MIILKGSNTCVCANGMQVTTKFRNPEPGSRPETYSLPPSKGTSRLEGCKYSKDGTDMLGLAL